MARLKDTGGGATIGVSETSKVFYVNAGDWHIYLGGTPSTSTLTLQMCPGYNPDTQVGTWTTYVADDGTGTPTDQTFSTTQVSASTKRYHRWYVDRGMYFRFVADAVGTPAWEIDVTGEHVRFYD